jgi:hypothetical protein
MTLAKLIIEFARQGERDWNSVPILLKGLGRGLHDVREVLCHV